MAKILLVHHASTIGGATTSLYNLIKMFQEENEVKVVCPSVPGDYIKFLNEKKIPNIHFEGLMGSILLYSGGAKLYSRSLWLYLMLIKKTKRLLTEIIKKEKPDLVIFNSMVLSWCTAITKPLGIKSICYVRETIDNNLSLFVMRHFLNKFDGVSFISEYDMKKMNLKNPIARVIRNCVNIEDFQTQVSKEDALNQLNLSSDFFNVLYVGGSLKLKGWDVIKSAMEHLKGKKIKLVVAGYIDETKIIKDESFVYLGVRTDMANIYKACDVLAFPSTKAHQARPIFEAGYMKMPVIISDFKQTSEYITNMVNGITVTPNDPISLAKAIEVLYNDRELCKNLGEKNYDISVKNHDYSKISSNVKEFISDIIGF